jgi:exodeoxyribonuclease VII large subunit
LRLKLLEGKLKNPRILINLKKQNLVHQQARLKKEMLSLVRGHKDTLSSQLAMLDSLSPLKVLTRGYAIVFKGEEVVQNAKQVKVDDTLAVQLGEGSLSVKVVGKDLNLIKK